MFEHLVPDVVLLGEVVEPLRGRGSLEEAGQGGGPSSFIVPSYFLLPLFFMTVDALWLHWMLLLVCLPYYDGLYPPGTGTRASLS